MKERPILFSGPMVRAILEGRKTQTRRVVKPQPEDKGHGVFLWKDEWCCESGDRPGIFSNYGVSGDRLWVRETWTHTGTGVWKVADALQALNGRILYAATDDAPCSGCWFPSIFMYRQYSRITLEITDVRVQRVNEISEDDAIAEGADQVNRKDGLGIGFRHAGDVEWRFASESFRSLWDSINAKRGSGWDTNPWVWALTFQRVTA